MTESPFKICLVEDDEIMGEALKDRFEIEGYACDWFKLGKLAKTAFNHQHFDVVICDIRLPDITGESLFEQLLTQKEVIPPFIFITGYGSVDQAVRLLKMGALDFLTKPLDIHALLEMVRRISQSTHVRLGNDPVLGVSAAMRSIENLLPRIANNADSVLITGESGVGKERVARFLHNLDDTENIKPFVAVNCGALNESLMEAELFGHVKGSFTGAIRNKKGLFEQADGGTLLLDEVGEMSPTMQVKLLRAIQERQIVRVGDDSPISVNLRLICATHRDLKLMVEQGAFREDLYYRIHIIHLKVPPLRERREDIIWLSQHMLSEHEQSTGDHRTLHKSAEKALMEYPWPGNVRELKHCLERACILSKKPVLTADILFAEETSTMTNHSNESLSDYLASCEKKYIESILMSFGGRIADTANALCISRKNLWEKMKKLEIHIQGK